MNVQMSQCETVINWSGIVDWNPCRSTQSSRDSSSYVVAVDNYVYVYCSSPDAGSYLMQCPGSTVWNPRAYGCSDFSDHSTSPPHLIGPLPGSGRSPHGVVSLVGDVATLSPMASPQITASYRQPLYRQPTFFAGIPYSSVSGKPSTLFRPPGSAAGDLASRLTANPCVVDDRGTLSALRFHPHPVDPSKYLECVPAERSVSRAYLLSISIAYSCDNH